MEGLYVDRARAVAQHSPRVFGGLPGMYKSMTFDAPVADAEEGASRWVRRSRPFPWRSALGRHRRVCSFFSSPREEYQTLRPFARDGLQRGDRAYHVPAAARSSAPTTPIC